MAQASVPASRHDRSRGTDRWVQDANAPEPSGAEIGRCSAALRRLALHKIELSSRLPGFYTCVVRTRRVLVVVSVLCVAASLTAVLEGAWVCALALYGMGVIGLAALLQRAVKKHRTQDARLLRTALDDATSDAGVQPGAIPPYR